MTKIFGQIFRAIIRSLRVVAGEHSLNDESGLEQNRDVAFYSMHPRYTAKTWEDDIALIVVSSVLNFRVVFSDKVNILFIYFHSQLKEPFDLSVPSAKPVNLPPPTSEYDAPAGTVLTVSGWGTTRVIFFPFSNSAPFFSIYGNLGDK